MNNNISKSTVWTRALTALAAISVAALLSSCAHLNPPEPTPEPEPAVVEKKPPPKPIKPPPPSPLYEWWGKDYVSHIEVSINEQKARFYEGDKMVGWTTVASGVRKFPTPTGNFAVTEKVQDKKSNLYGKIYNKNGKLVRRNAKMGVHRVPAGGRFKGAPMPYFMRLTNDGIGMHAGPIPRPGNRASHGCIRMPRNFAPILYRHVDIGTPVTIKGNGPAYASYVAKQRKSTPKPKAVAVAKVKPPATPANNALVAEPTPASTPEPASTPASTIGQSVPEQTVASVPQQPTVTAPEPNPSTATLQQPAAQSTVEASGTAPAQVSTEPHPSLTTEEAPQTVGMAGAPSSPPAQPTQAPVPAAMAAPIPAVPQSIPPTTTPSMSGAPAAPAPAAPATPDAPPAGQQSAPVSSAPPPAVTEPAAQAEG